MSKLKRFVALIFGLYFSVCAVSAEDYHVNLLVIGEPRSGKSSLIARLVQGRMSTHNEVFVDGRIYGEVPASRDDLDRWTTAMQMSRGGPNREVVAQYRYGRNDWTDRNPDANVYDVTLHIFEAQLNDPRFDALVANAHVIIVMFEFPDRINWTPERIRAMFGRIKDINQTGCYVIFNGNKTDLYHHRFGSTEFDNRVYEISAVRHIEDGSLGATSMLLGDGSCNTLIEILGRGIHKTGPGFGPGWINFSQEERSGFFGCCCRHPIASGIICSVLISGIITFGVCL